MKIDKICDGCGDLFQDFGLYCNECSRFMKFREKTKCVKFVSDDLKDFKKGKIRKQKRIDKYAIEIP